MDNWLREILEKFRVYRSQKLLPVGHFFLRWHITANVMTFFSFIAGMGAVYFFSQNHFWFVFLAVLHLLLDGIDGVIARVSRPTVFGKYFDTISDQLVGILLLLKIAVVTNDYFVSIIAALVLTSQLFYLLTKFTAPAFFPRTSLLVLLLLNQVTLGYLVAGVIGAYTLSVQFLWMLQRKRG